MLIEPIYYYSIILHPVVDVINASKSCALIAPELEVSSLTIIRKVYEGCSGGGLARSADGQVFTGSTPDTSNLLNLQ